MTVTATAEIAMIAILAFGQGASGQAAQARPVPIAAEAGSAMQQGPHQAKETALVSLAMDFLARLGRSEFEDAVALLHEDAVVDLPYAGTGITVTGRDAILGFFRKSMGGKVAHIGYRLEQAYPASDGNVVVLEVSTDGTSASGMAFTNRLVTIFRFREGRIDLFREYFNPLAGA